MIFSISRWSPPFWHAPNKILWLKQRSDWLGNHCRPLYLWVLNKLQSISTKRQDKGLDPLASILSTLREDSCKSRQDSKVNLKPLVTNAAPRAPWPPVIDAAMPGCKIAIVVRWSCHGTITNSLIFQTNRNRTPCYGTTDIMSAVRKTLKTFKRHRDKNRDFKRPKTLLLSYLLSAIKTR